MDNFKFQVFDTILKIVLIVLIVFAIALPTIISNRDLKNELDIIKTEFITYKQDTKIKIDNLERRLYKLELDK